MYLLHRAGMVGAAYICTRPFVHRVQGTKNPKKNCRLVCTRALCAVCATVPKNMHAHAAHRKRKAEAVQALKFHGMRRSI
jgi:hypothetical protein